MSAETAVEEANDPTIDARANTRLTGLGEAEDGEKERLLGWAAS